MSDLYRHATRIKIWEDQVTGSGLTSDPINVDQGQSFTLYPSVNASSSAVTLDTITLYSGKDGTGISDQISMSAAVLTADAITGDTLPLNTYVCKSCKFAISSSDSSAVISLDLVSF